MEPQRFKLISPAAFTEMALTLADGRRLVLTAAKATEGVQTIDPLVAAALDGDRAFKRVAIRRRRKPTQTQEN